jgi:hypothetical protein
MDIPSLQELKVHLKELEQHRDEFMMYNPKNETESLKQQIDLKIINERINTQKIIIAGGGIVRGDH